MGWSFKYDPKNLKDRRLRDWFHKISGFVEAPVSKGTLSADFFIVLMHSGLRLGEGLGISLADLFPGEPDVALIKGAAQRHGLKCFGYISLESQLSSAIHPRRIDGTVPRKPLKGRKRIDAKGSRTIPVFNQNAYNALARRFNGKRSANPILDGRSDALLSSLISVRVEMTLPMEFK